LQDGKRRLEKRIRPLKCHPLVIFSLFIGVPASQDAACRRVMLVQLALGVAVGYGPPPTRRVALRLSAAEPPPEAASGPFSYGEYSLREQASNAVWNLVVKPAVERRRREMEAAARMAADPALARAPVLVPEDAPAVASAVASTAAATPQEVDAVALAVHELSSLAGSAAVPYSASQIVHAFNAWKTAVGRKYSNLDGEALELRAFAGNPSLIAKYLHHVVEVPQPAERTTVLTIPAPVPGEDWRITLSLSLTLILTVTVIVTLTLTLALTLALTLTRRGLADSLPPGSRRARRRHRGGSARGCGARGGGR